MTLLRVLLGLHVVLGLVLDVETTVPRALQRQDADGLILNVGTTVSRALWVPPRQDAVSCELCLSLVVASSVSEVH